MAEYYLKQKWDGIPPEIKTFLFRAILILVVWKSLYLAILQPYRILDAPLTQSVGKLTAATLNVCTQSLSFSSKTGYSADLNIDGSKREVVELVVFNHRNLLSIADACNALELFVLYLGLIWALPALLKRKFFYSVSGVFIIYLANILRCTGLSLLAIYYPAVVDFAHHYLFTMIVYAIIVALWFGFTQKLTAYGPEE